MEEKKIEETEKSIEIKKEVDYIETEKGSMYKYLPDGRTQKFKKVEGRYYEPQNAMVFIPNWEWVSKNAPEKILKKLGENEIQYEQSILEYRDIKGGKIYIIDAKGNKLETNKDIKNVKKSGGQIFLWFGHPENINNQEKVVEDFTIPVSSQPKEGFYTFDTRKYKEADEVKREIHIGNKVKNIVYKK